MCLDCFPTGLSVQWTGAVVAPVLVTWFTFVSPGSARKTTLFYFVPESAYICVGTNS